MITITSEDFSCLHSHLDRTDKYNTWTIKYYAPNANKILALEISDNQGNYFRVDCPHIDPLEINDHLTYARKVIDQMS
jgi:hypothetical protein